MSAVMSVFDRLLGRGEHAITVPALDGAFKANSLLDRADVALDLEAADNLATLQGNLVVSSGCQLYSVPDEHLISSFDANISFVTSLPDGGIVVGLVNGDLRFVGGRMDGQSVGLPESVRCPTAAARLDADTLLVVNGSAVHGPEAWTRDLLSKGATGSLWKVSLSSGKAEQLSKGLAFPYGVLSHDGGVIVAESWKSRLLRYDLSSGRQEEVIGNLPGYPSRLIQDTFGHFWLTLFAPRSQLVEFVLRENKYRSRMLNEIAPEFWIAPCLRSGRSFLEPLQAGGVKQLGVLKPWSPSRSYGLIVELDHDFFPLRSFHSRADGYRHGVTSCAMLGRDLYFTAKGDDCVASLKLEQD